jgi:hypothetical protein
MFNEARFLWKEILRATRRSKFASPKSLAIAHPVFIH